MMSLLHHICLCVQQFQELEEQRIAFLRHQMWTLCNYCSQAMVDVDEVGVTPAHLVD